MTLARATLLAALAVAAGCGGQEAPPAPAATWLAEPLAAVRTSELVAGGGDSAPTLANPYENDPGAEAQGRQLYQSFNCAGCHGGGGGGGIGPPLADAEWIYGGSAASIYASVVQGRPNGMPAFGPSLRGEAVWKIAAYVRTLGGGKAQEAPKGETEAAGRGAAR